MIFHSSVFEMKTISHVSSTFIQTEKRSVHLQSQQAQVMQLFSWLLKVKKPQNEQHDSN